MRVSFFFILLVARVSPLSSPLLIAIPYVADYAVMHSIRRSNFAS